MPEQLSAVSSPEEATQRSAALISSVDEPSRPVLIDLPADMTVELPGGGVFLNGEWHNKAVVRELTGEAEEVMSRAQAAGSFSRYIRALLQYGVESIGSIENPTPEQLGGLLIGDRDMLVLKIRVATYGPEFEVPEIRCVSCGAKLAVTVDLDKDVPIRTLDPDPQQREFTVPLRRGSIATVQLPTAEVQDKVLDLSGKTVAELNTLMLADTVIDVDGRPLLGEQGARGLPMADRTKLVDFLGDKQPGPRLGEVTEHCPTCDTELPLSIAVADLFR